MQHALAIAGAGLVAGVMNAIAGGGTFVTFPTLVFAGVPAVSANASSTVALFPGFFAASFAYRDLFCDVGGVSVRALLPVSVAGGLAGAVLLLITPEATFRAVIPWLLLAGTLAFAFGNRIGPWLRRRFRLGRGALFVAQFLLAIYGGYFGAAVGLMMMAAWCLFDDSDIHGLLAAKNLLVGATNAIAVAAFIAAGKVWWPQTLLLLAAASVGGFLGALSFRRVNPGLIRLLVNAVNVAMTAVFFLR